MQTLPETRTLLQIAADRPCPKWCDHAVCEALDDVDGVTRLHTRIFWRSDDGDRCVEWSRHDIHTADGVVVGNGEMFCNLPNYGEEDAHREALIAAFAFVYELGRAARSE